MSHEANNAAQGRVAACVLLEKAIPLVELAKAAFDPSTRNALELALGSLRGAVAANAVASAPRRPGPMPGDVAF